MVHDTGPLGSWTRPAEAVWPPTAPGYRRGELSRVVGRGTACWHRAGTDLLCWQVKSRSGFVVAPPGPARLGPAEVTVRGLGRLVVEPIEVVEVVQTAERVGLAYRTRPGHPVSGEEAFVLSREEEDVRLTLRSLTAPGDSQPWRAAFGLLLVAQRVVRRRYLRALG